MSSESCSPGAASSEAATNLTRRSFIRLTVLGTAGLVLGAELRPAHASTRSVALGPLIRIGVDGGITLFAQNPEMGQGVKTALPMILAEELGVSWEDIVVAQADWLPGNDRQFSGGSLSVRLNYEAMRLAGAAAREMLMTAAAKRWRRERSMLEARGASIVDRETGDRIGFGELADMASRVPVPDSPPLANPGDFRLVGNPVSDVDLERMLTGEQAYSLDVRLPDMLYVVVRRAPLGDAQPVDYDDRNARRVPGVVGIRMLRNTDYGGRIILPNCPNFVSGVAVAAETTWAALEGARQLDVDWQLPDERDDSSALAARFEAALDKPATIIRDDGDVDAFDPDVSIEAEYELPFLAHVPMEPMNCTASVSGDGVEIWAPTQNPGMLAEAVAKALDIDQRQITIHVLRSGGAFGRRYYADFAVDTAILSRDFGRPIKVVWPREDDVRHDYFRPASRQRVRAGVDRDGRISSWSWRVVSHPRDIYLEREGEPSEIGSYEFPAGFIPNLRYEYRAEPARIPLGQWRAVDHSSNVFVACSAIDELARAAGRDPLEFWLALIGDRRIVPVIDGFDFDASRLRNVIETVAQQAEWDRPLPRGRGRGLAASYNQGAWVAEVAEVTIADDALRVDRIVAAIDCGLLINPAGAEAQVQGAIIEGLSAALYGEITVSDGVVEQSNFDDYRLCRMGEAPAIDIRFVDSNDAPRGLGEPPLPPVAPAVCNAIYAASGQRIRRLPIRSTLAIA